MNMVITANTKKRLQQRNSRRIEARKKGATLELLNVIRWRDLLGPELLDELIEQAHKDCKHVPRLRTH